MAPFDFKSDKHFLASSDKLTIRIYELISKNAIANPSSIRKNHWSEVAVIVPSRDNVVDDNDDDDDDAKEYNGLIFFDGYGEILEQTALTKLAQELTRLRLMVSPEGYCYQDVTEFGELKDFGIHYLRLNDLFDWSLHGVDLATTTVWRRSKLRYLASTYDKQTKQTSKQGGGGAVISKEKYEDLKKLMKAKEEETERLREEKDEAEEELQRLKDETDTEMEEVKKKNNHQLRKLTKERDQSLNREADLKRKLEICRNSSWSGLPSENSCRDDEEKQFHLTSRRPVPPATFNFIETPGLNQIYYSEYCTPEIKDGSDHLVFKTYLVVNDTEAVLWPAPPEVDVGTVDGKFDARNWWFAKTSAPEGGVTMMAYYDGDFNSVTVSSSVTGEAIPLPYSKDTAFRPQRTFVLARLPVGIRLAFVYRN